MKIICECGNGIYKQNKNGVWCVGCYPEVKGDPCKKCGYDKRFLYERGYTACQQCGVIFKNGRLTRMNIDSKYGVALDLVSVPKKRGRPKMIYGKQFTETRNKNKVGGYE